jgi:dipeptidyl aminopeptidase/acylaminoacyl peptidase
MTAKLAPPQECKFTSAHDGTEQTYLLDMPPQLPAAGLMVYLHGATGHQDQGMTAETFCDSFGFMRRWAARHGWAYACPEYRGDSWMNAAAEADITQLAGILRLRAAAPVSILLGGSMGGTSAMIYAARRQGVFDGVLSFCPATDMAELHELSFLRDNISAAYGGDPRRKAEEYAARSTCLHAESLAQTPLYIVHGDVDAVLPVSQVRRLVEGLKRLHATYQYVEIAGGGHDAPLRPQYIQQGLEWLIGRIAAVSAVQFPGRQAEQDHGQGT